MQIYKSMQRIQVAQELQGVEIPLKEILLNPLVALLEPFLLGFIPPVFP